MIKNWEEIFSEEIDWWCDFRDSLSISGLSAIDTEYVNGIFVPGAYTVNVNDYDIRTQGLEEITNGREPKILEVLLQNLVDQNPKESYEWHLDKLRMTAMLVLYDNMSLYMPFFKRLLASCIPWTIRDKININY